MLHKQLFPEDYANNH